DVLASRVDRADRRGQFLVDDGLEQITARTGLERAKDVFLPFVAGDDDDQGLGPFPANRSRRLEAIDAWKPQIHEHDVWLALTIELERLRSGAGLGDDFHIRLHIDRGLEADADDEVVVDDEHADFRWEL